MADAPRQGIAQSCFADLDGTSRDRRLSSNRLFNRSIYSSVVSFSQRFLLAPIAKTPGAVLRRRPSSRSLSGTQITRGKTELITIDRYTHGTFSFSTHFDPVNNAERDLARCFATAFPTFANFTTRREYKNDRIKTEN